MRGFGEVAERLRRSTARVFTRGSGGGSGIVWSADGLILTNAHVARDGAAEVELWDSRRRPAAIVARDPRRDLATLRISADGLEPAAAGDSASLRPGELVLAVGSPLGFAGALIGDVLLRLGGRAVADIEELQAAIEKHGVGKRVPLDLWRAGAPHTVEIVIGERPRRS
jgi:serine protease Do